MVPVALVCLAVTALYQRGAGATTPNTLMAHFSDSDSSGSSDGASADGAPCVRVHTRALLLPVCPHRRRLLPQPPAPRRPTGS